MSRMAKRAPEEAVRAVETTREVRELIFRIICAATSGATPHAQDVDAFNGWVSTSRTEHRLVAVAGGLVWREIEAAVGLEKVLPAVIRSAVDLLTDPIRRSRVRLCAAERCDWAFVDVSRSGRRIWCDMSVCGNRAKAKRHYQKTRVSDA